MSVRKILRGVSRRDYLMLGVGAVIALIITNGILMGKRAAMPEPLTNSNVSGALTISWLPPSVQRWEPLILEQATKYNLDPDFIAIIMTLESGGYTKAGSEADAKGLMQITPPTAQDIATKFLQKPVKTYDLFNPKTNVEFGVAYLAYLRDEFGTKEQGPSWNVTVELIAAGYNGGPGAANRVEQGKGLIDTQTVVYARDVFNMWRERHQKTSPTFDRWVERGGSELLALAAQEQ